MRLLTLATVRRWAVLRYLAALGRHATALVGGCAVMVALGVFERARARPLPCSV